MTATRLRTTPQPPLRLTGVLKALRLRPDPFFTAVGAKAIRCQCTKLIAMTDLQLGPAAVQIFAASERMNQMLIEHLDPTAWRAKPACNIRSIVAIFTHMHNVRCKWVRLTSPHLPVPAQLNRAHCTTQQARDALANSAASCQAMLADVLSGPTKKFRRDGWASEWPAGPEMLCYMISHEAHHRGQVCMLAHQFGFPLPKSVASAIWNWEKLLL